MIKLQLLLRHPSRDPGLEPALRAQLEALGMVITGAGRASVSATMAQEDFERVFGPPRPNTSGFARDPLAAPDLSVPASLDDAISMISIAPHHCATNNKPRGKHAAF